MTQADYIFIVQALFQDSQIELRVNPATINQALNESMQGLWAIAVAADDTFWIRTQTFSSTTNAAYPENFARLLLVEVPTAAQGTAYPVSHVQWQTVQNNDVITATAEYPNYREDAGGIYLSPSVAGTMYYLGAVPEITDWTVDLTAFGGSKPAILPWPMEEAYIMGAISILAKREMGKPGLPESDVKKLFDLSESAKAVYDATKSRYAIFHQSVVTPALPPKQGDAEQQ